MVIIFEVRFCSILMSFRLLKCECICFFVFLCRQLIYNYPEQLFADSGVMAIEHADFEGIERLALVTGKNNTTELRKKVLMH